jgi:WD40 repeat protein
MKKKANSLQASALQVTFISLSGLLLTLSGAPANQLGPGAVGAVKSHQALLTHEENLTPPAGLKPVEQEAWVAMARRQGTTRTTDSSWTMTGSMSTARYSQTATLLPSGKVLVAGGVNGVLSSAELYDPATGTWTATGSMATARSYHTATLLPSGKVLVAGGHGSTGNLSSAELYDPATGTWIATGSLVRAREYHTATLLPSGKVLVAGGQMGEGDPFHYLSEAELYDPATGTWMTTGSMSNARSSPTATLLLSGKVLVSGGWNGASLKSADLYDPATGTWTATGNMATARSSHTATLLPSGEVLVGGGTGRGFLSSAELYDPVTGTWTATGSMATARFYHTATLLPSGKVLVAGGFDGSSYLNSAELYDPVAGTWMATASLDIARRFHTATLLSSGKVLVAGGYGNTRVAGCFNEAFLCVFILGSAHKNCGNLAIHQCSPHPIQPRWRRVS